MPSFKLILYNVLLWFLVNAGLRNGIPLTLILDLLAVTGAVIFTFIVSFLLPSQVLPPFSKVIFFPRVTENTCVCPFTSELYIGFCRGPFPYSGFNGT